MSKRRKFSAEFKRGAIDQTRQPERDRFESARGKAQIKWRTDDLMALLRG